jgi:FtsP/CotA-like multicopper oxidase with cupredoxin domain
MRRQRATGDGAALRGANVTSKIKIGARTMNRHVATCQSIAARQALFFLLTVAASAIGASPVSAQAPGAQAPGAQGPGAPQPTSQTLPCPDPASQDFIQPPEIAYGPDHVLRGTVNLVEQAQRIPSSVAGGPITCAPQLVRVFQGEGLPPAPPAQKPVADYADPIPGPTLRGYVGGHVELAFVNMVNPSLFDRNLVLEACTRVGQNGQIYPDKLDTYPNCLHASSTANMHFHGTHTSPSSTADNVYLEIPPLLRDNQGKLLPAQPTAGFAEFFKDCRDQIKNPLHQWPTRWSDMPQAWYDEQSKLLMQYQQKYPDQPLWDKDQAVRDKGWPQYYVGAFPYCFPLPAYTADVWPPPSGSNSPNMGQAPGTHWYHAHKHGSTAINVGNGMTGAFIIEGKYDEDLQTFYGRYMLKDGPWDVHKQPVIVLNQLVTTPNRISGGGPTALDFVVNGRLRSIVHMQPGEVQLWRIVNTAGRSAAYFMAPDGFEWRQIAQDGVQFADENYQDSTNRPIFVAPGNRIDLLVKAPMKETTLQVNIQNVMGRGRVKPTPANPTPTDPFPGTPLLSISVSGQPVRLGPTPVQMPFINKAPTQPPFLVDIEDWELRKSNYASVTLDFNSKARGSAEQHTINGIQFADQKALVPVQLATAQEWTIKNSTGKNPGIIDHPFHIHINPFQITEVFDPNENLTDPSTGQLEGKLNPTTKKTEPIPKYILVGQPKTDPRQCFLNPDDPSTWRPCQHTAGRYLVWWDVFAIPSGRAAPSMKDPNNVIPGYFKMRSRFVDYAGLYVLHCHILIHEDRGMMFGVQVGPPQPVLVSHH